MSQDLEQPVRSKNGLGEDLTRRALAAVTTSTTDMASDVLRVPLSYYRDHEVFRREEESLCRTPIAVAHRADWRTPLLHREVCSRHFALDHP